MAAPQTHLWIAFVFRGVMSLLGIIFSPLQLIVVYFWGFGMDFVDHFTSPNYTRDVFFVRIPRFLRGGEIGAPSKGIEPPPCWLHIWPGLILVLASGWFFPLTLSWVPLLFWAQHVVLDKFQRNDGSYANIPFWYPVKKKNWTPQGGYPVKPRIEVLVSTVLAVLTLIVEGYMYLFR